MAVAAMSVIAIAWHQTMEEQAPGCQALSFAANWEFTAPDLATIRLGADATTDLFALLKLTAAPGKSWTWATQEKDRNKIGRVVFGGSLPQRMSDARELGAHLCYGTRPTGGKTLADRIHRTIPDS